MTGASARSASPSSSSSPLGRLAAGDLAKPAPVVDLAGALRRLAALTLLLGAPGCLKEYTIGGAGSTDDDHNDSEHDSDDTSHDSETCPEGQEGCGEDTACPEGQEGCDPTCSTACGDSPCPEGQVQCGEGCVAADACCDGTCDAQRERCDGGECRCRDGLVRCGETCVDTRSDPRHCGECDNDCGDQGVCNASKCAEGCGDGRVDCDGACVVLAEDPLHCDDCGSACAGDEVCLAGDCRPFAYAGACLTCPCPSACAGDLEVCCDSAYLGAAVCVDNGCG